MIVRRRIPFAEISLALLAIACVLLVGLSRPSTRSASAPTATPTVPSSGMTIYSVTNPNAFKVSVQHVFSDSNGVELSFWEDVPAQSSLTFHVSAMPQIPRPYSGSLNLYANQPFTSQVVGYDPGGPTLTATPVTSPSPTSQVTGTPTPSPSPSLTPSPTGTSGVTNTPTPTSSPTATMPPVPTEGAALFINGFEETSFAAGGWNLSIGGTGSTALQVTSPVFSGLKAGGFTTQTQSGGEHAFAQASFLWPGSHVVQAQGWVQPALTSVQFTTRLFSLEDQGPSSWATRAGFGVNSQNFVAIYTDTNGVGHDVDTGTAYQNGQWYQLAVLVDQRTTSPVFTFLVNGAPVYTYSDTLAGSNQDHPVRLDVGLGPGNWGVTSGTVYVDSVSVWNGLAQGTATPSATTTPTASPTPTNTLTATSTRTATPTFTPTATMTASSTSTFTPTLTSSPTLTFTATATTTATPSSTSTSTATSSPTSTPSNTPTSSPTASATNTSTSTPTSPPTTTPTSTSTSSPTKTSTATSTTVPSSTPTGTASSTPTLAPTTSPTASSTMTATPTPSSTPTLSPSVTSTPTPTRTITSTPTATSTSTPSFTATPTPSFTPTVPPSRTSTSTPTSTPSVTPSSTSTLTSTSTPTVTPSTTSSATSTATPSATLTSTPTMSATSTPSSTLTPTSSPTTTASSTATVAPSTTPTHTPTVTGTQAPSRTPTATPDYTATATVTPTSSGTATSTGTSTMTASPTTTSTPTSVPPSDTATSTPPSDTATATPTDIPTVVPTDTPTAVPTAEHAAAFVVSTEVDGSAVLVDVPIELTPIREVAVAVASPVPSITPTGPGVTVLSLEISATDVNGAPVHHLDVPLTVSVTLNPSPGLDPRLTEADTIDNRGQREVLPTTVDVNDDGTYTVTVSMPHLSPLVIFGHSSTALRARVVLPFVANVAPSVGW